MITAGTQLLSLWRRLSPLPGGPWLFSKLFGFAVPYSGSVRPRIRVLEPGHAVVHVAVPTVGEDRDFEVTAECFDGQGSLVATGHVRWRLGPVRPKAV